MFFGQFCQFPQLKITKMAIRSIKISVMKNVEKR